MTDLLDKLREAREGSRELDALIWAEIDGRDVRTNDNNLVLAKSRAAPHDECIIGWIDPGEHSKNFTAHQSINRPQYHYTTSIDAALTLLDGNCLWAVGHRGDEKPDLFQATLMPMGKQVSAEADTPALAICTAWAEMQAALEARNG